MAATALAPSTSGSPAATTAPKAASRMISISTPEISSARLPSLVSWAAIAFIAETSPNCSTRTPGCAFWAAATAASGRSTSFSTCSSEPSSAKFTSTERPSAERSGSSMSVTPSIFPSLVATSAAVAARRGSPAVVLCTRTCSPDWSGKPAASTMRSPRLDSPLPVADSSRSSRPTLPPATAARTTNAIHPRMAFRRCWALHLPMRAARFPCCMTAPP